MLVPPVVIRRGSQYRLFSALRFNVRLGNILLMMFKKFSFLIAIVIVVGLILVAYSQANIYHSSVPLIFNDADIPLVEVSIEGKSYMFKLDLGCDAPLMCDKELLSQLSKTRYGTSSYCNVRGIEYESPTYVIPEIKIGNISFVDIIASSLNYEDIGSTTLWGNKSELRLDHVQPYLGHFFLEKRNVLFNFLDGVLIISNSPQKLREEGYDLDEMLKVTLEDRNGLFIKVETDFGIKTFMIDTGSTTNLINASLVDRALVLHTQKYPEFVFSKFKIGNKDFCNTTCAVFEGIPDVPYADGIIGMNFLENRVIYVDYKNKTLYLEN